MRCPAPWAIGLLCSLVAVAPLGVVAEDPPGAYQAPDPEPTPEEVLILEFINRARANPDADVLRIAPPGKSPRDGVDFDMFRKEMAEFQPMPPLVFDLALLKAARWHSSYQQKHGQGHNEEPGKAGFTGATPGDRVRAAGAPQGGWGENCFIFGKDPWDGHVAFVVDYGAGPGGMLAGRGHRRNILNPGFTLVGCGSLPNGGTSAVTHVFSTAGPRHVGGVVYDDRDRDGFYDVGEGIGGLEISSGDTTTTSWKSGGYALAIGDREAKVSISIEGKKYSKTFPAGGANIKFDVTPPSPAELAAAGKLLKQVAAIPDNEANAARRFAGLVRLSIECQSLMVDDDTATEIEALTAAARTQLAESQAAVRKALEGDDMAAAKRTIDAEKKPFKATVASTWFLDATLVAGLRERHLELAAAKAAGKAVNEKVVAREAEAMEKLLSRLKTAEWLAFARDVIKQTVGLKG